MTEETRSRLDKLQYDISDILFDLVDENETLEGQVNELREQVARLTENQNRKTVDVKLGGELIYRQAVLEAIEDDTRLGMYSRFASNDDAQLFKQVINELPSVENKGEDRPKGYWIDREVYDADRWKCSECGRTEQYKENYCPDCGADMKEELTDTSTEESENQSTELYCTDCPYFQFTGEPSDDWYGARCNKDNHEASPSMYAIQSLNDNCPLNRG